MNTIWLQVVVSGVLLIVIAWRTFVDVFATLGTITPNDHPLSVVSLLIVRLTVILLLLRWFVVSWRKRNRFPFVRMAASSIYLPGAPPVALRMRKALRLVQRDPPSDVVANRTRYSACRLVGLGSQNIFEANSFRQIKLWALAVAT